MKPIVRQRGFSIIAAIFLIVILSALAAFAVTLFRVQQGSATLDQQGYRALQAAYAGFDWGAWQVLRNPPPPAAAPACPAATNLTMPAGGSLGLFRATVTCTRTQHAEAGTTASLYRIVSTACFPATAGGVCPNPAPTADYVERQFQGTIER